MSEHSVPQLRMREYLQLVATGPELSKSLDRTQARDAMGIILRGEADPIRCGIFLIALRMKRETDEENIGVMDALQSEMTRAAAKSPIVLAMADPFNGFLRSIPATPFVPAVQAAGRQHRRHEGR
ncbi:MAG: anthranilate phosphoribosyltransferase, partial [Gammaproteobacteria bacterium]|nr:anthranilate phosphoribosyltransferase [Gammaproteobacteria bacterium]